MTRLTIHPAAAPETILLATADFAKVAAQLQSINVVLERWATPAALSADADAAAVLAAYAKPVDYLLRARGYQSTDVVRVPRGMADAAGLRAKFLTEHTHAEDEARFFVEGRGAFYLRDGDRVLMVACNAGDLLLIPAHLPHWFDMGLDPCFTAIRFFTRPDGWVAELTGDPVSDRFPPFTG